VRNNEKKCKNVFRFLCWCLVDKNVVIRNCYYFEHKLKQDTLGLLLEWGRTLNLKDIWKNISRTFESLHYNSPTCSSEKWNVMPHVYDRTLKSIFDLCNRYDILKITTVMWQISCHIYTPVCAYYHTDAHKNLYEFLSDLVKKTYSPIRSAFILPYKISCTNS
jgi:hypothetical protein